MPLSAILIFSVVGGLVLAILMKLLFNKITGKHASDFSDLADFFGIFIGSSFILFIILITVSCESMS